jgi:hypothetical protein
MAITDTKSSGLSPLPGAPAPTTEMVLLPEGRPACKRVATMTDEVWAGASRTGMLGVMPTIGRGRPCWHAVTQRRASFAIAAPSVGHARIQ